ncbi:MAG: hypothetical protein ACJAZM_002294 [Cyclobacteriaceae bacterium]|jgi:hypothetical protein
MVAGFACTDLEEELKADFTEGFEPNNQGFGESENVNGSLPNDGLNAAYNRLRDGSAGHSSYFSVAEISTDEVVITQKGGDWFDGGIWLNMHKHDFRDTNPGLTNAWNNLYGGVTQCNDLIAAGGLSADQTAQLRAVRAFFFLRLIDMFGNVKLTTVNGVDQAQATRAEAFAFIESEVLAAIPDLGVGRVYGRFNQSVAYSMLARLYLNAEVYAGTPRWQDAIDAADMVINSGLYDLDPEYANVFSPSNVDNIEHIYAIPYDEATGTGMNFAQMTLHYPSQLTYDLQQQPWNGYSTLEEFYNSYDAADVRRANNFIAGPQSDINGNPILDVAFDPADPDGAAINYTPFINELAPSGSRQAGARMGKYSFKVGQLPEMDNDYTLFRYGELLLVKAEAQSRLAGDWNVGIDLVNQVRTRAGMPAYTALTGEEFYAERGREVFQESLRRTDMIRFDTWGNAWWEKPAHSDAFKNIMPIPLEQINASLNGDIALIQNPGY